MQTVATEAVDVVLVTLAMLDTLRDGVRAPLERRFSPRGVMTLLEAEPEPDWTDPGREGAAPRPDG